MPRRKVLFLCIGNSCRSQMAEGFARTYGSDVMESQSAGIGPASSVSPLTVATMKEKNIDMSAAVPKGLDAVDRAGLSVIVNITGRNMPVPGVTVVDWNVRDPIGQDEKVFREVRDEIERLVMNLILRFRLEQLEPVESAKPTEDSRSKVDTQRDRFR
jgi:arsenate reductase